MYFFHIPTMPSRKKRERSHVKSVTGQQAQLSFIFLDPGEVTNHHHPQEQIGYVLSGKVEITIDGLTKTLGPGDAYRIPPNAPHGFTVLTEQRLEILEVFCPPKEENRTDP